MKTILGCFLFFVSLSQAGFQPDPSRSHLGALDSRGRMDWADFQDDFLISQSAEISDFSSTDLIKRLKNQHSKSLLNWDSLAAKNFENLEFPQTVVSGEQLKGLNECNLEKCSFKLQRETETALLIKSKDRVKAFKELVVQRLKAFAHSKAVKGYEQRMDNIPYFKKAFRLSRFLKTRYPLSYEYLESDFWKNIPHKKGPSGSYYRAELVHITADKLQPVYRLSHHLEFEEKGYLNVELHLYTNHFFDSSIRIFEIFPYPGNPQKSIYIVTDLMEIDELKKSNLIRKLFQTPMEEAISEFRKSEMKELR